MRPQFLWCVLISLSSVIASTGTAVASPHDSALPHEASAHSQSADHHATNREVLAALARSNEEGGPSSVDRAIVLSRPDIAAVVIDPSSGTWTVHSDGTRNVRAVDPSSAALTTVRSRFVDRYISYSTWYGGAALQYHFTVQWNYDGARVTATPVRGHYTVINGPGIIDHGLTENTASKQGAQPYAYRVSMQGHVEQCILKFGCIASVDPYTRFGVYYDGTYSIYQQK